MNQQRTSGIILALLAASSFGLIPLLAIPLLYAGATPQTVLLYSFFPSAIFTGAVLLARGASLRVQHADAARTAWLGAMNFLTVLCYICSLQFLPGGTAATIQFIYPVMIVLIMTPVFHRHFRMNSFAAVLLSISGAALLSWENACGVEHSGACILWGVILALLSALFNAIYFTGIQMARISRVDGIVLNFHVMGFGSLYCAILGIVTDSLQWIAEPALVIIALALALVTGVFSNLSLILAVRRIGFTLSSILGVMEPVTAAFVGVLVFGETFTARIAVGMVMILAAVLMALRTPLLPSCQEAGK